MLLFGKTSIKIFYLMVTNISNNSEFDQYLKRLGYVLKMKVKRSQVMPFLKIKKLY